MEVKKKIVVSISYFDFEFDTLQDADMFAILAASTITDKSRDIEIRVKYDQPADDAENEEEEE